MAATRMHDVKARPIAPAASTTLRILQGVEYDGDYDYIDVGEDADTYVTDIFLCNEGLVRLSDEEAERPKVAGDFIRVCVRPTVQTLDRGAVMRRIDGFKFTKEEWQEARTGDDEKDSQGSPIVTQLVVVEGQEQEHTLLTCEPGSDVCVFKTILEQGFFREDGIVKGTGAAFLEFGKQEQSVFGGIGKRRRRNLRGTDRRGLQDTDTGFAGIWRLELEFSVEKSISQNLVGQANDTWEDMNQGARYGIIAAILMILLCFMFCLFYCCAYLYKRDREMSERVDGHFPKMVKVDPRASFFDLFMHSWNRNLSHDCEGSEYDGDSVVNGAIVENNGPSFGDRDETVGSTAIVSVDPEDDSTHSVEYMKDLMPTGGQALSKGYAEPSKTKKKPFLRPRPPPIRSQQQTESQAQPAVKRKPATSTTAKANPIKEVLERESQRNDQTSGVKKSTGQKRSLQLPKQGKQSPVLSDDRNDKQKQVKKDAEPLDDHGEDSTAEETDEHSSSEEFHSSMDVVVSTTLDDRKMVPIPATGSPSTHSVDISTLDVEEWSSDSENEGGDDEDDSVERRPKDNQSNGETKSASKVTPKKLANLENDSPLVDDDEESIDIVGAQLANTHDNASNVSDSESGTSHSESDFYPDPFDVAFDQKNHVGTMVLEMTIRKVASSEHGVKFSREVFDQIETELKGRTCYIEDEGVDRRKIWREATHPEKMHVFRNWYEKEVRQDLEMKQQRGAGGVGGLGTRQQGKGPRHIVRRGG